ncbi:MAG: helicase-related protein [Myxococcota bacterium]
MSSAALPPGRTALLDQGPALLQRGHPLAGLGGDALAFVLARAILAEPAGERRWLVVVDGDDRADALRRGLRFFLAGADKADEAVEPFPGDDNRPYDGFSPDPALVRQRIRALHKVGRGGDVVVVATAAALLQRIPDAETLARGTRVVEVGGTVDRDALAAGLADAGYLATARADEPGRFAVRGDIVDVWPVGNRSPIRIDLFDDEVERLRRLDPQTLAPGKGGKRVTLLPAAETRIDPPALERALSELARWAAEQGGGELTVRRRQVVEELRAGIRFSGLGDWLPALVPTVAPLEAFAGLRTVVMLPDDVHAALRDLEATILQRFGALEPDERPIVPPHGRYERAADVIRALEPATEVLELASDRAPDLGATGTEALAVRGSELGPAVGRLLELAANDVRVALVVKDDGRGERLTELLAPHGLVPVAVSGSPFDVDAGKVSLLTGDLPRGFVAEASGWAFVPISALFGVPRRAAADRAAALWDQSVTSTAQLRVNGPSCTATTAWGCTAGSCASRCSPASRRTSSSSSTRAATSCSCPSPRSTRSRATPRPTPRPRPHSTSSAARPGRGARARSATTCSPWRRTSCGCTPGARSPSARPTPCRRAARGPARRWARATWPSSSTSRTRRPTTRPWPSTPSWTTCRGPTRWTAWCVATWASARPRWRCAPPCGSSRRGTRWPCSAPPPCSRTSTCTPSATASPTTPTCASACGRASPRRRSWPRLRTAWPTARSTSSSAPPRCWAGRRSSPTSRWSSSTRSTASGSSRRTGSSACAPRSTCSRCRPRPSRARCSSRSPACARCRSSRPRRPSGCRCAPRWPAAARVACATPSSRRSSAAGRRGSSTTASGPSGGPRAAAGWIPQARIAVAHGQMQAEDLEQVLVDFVEQRYDVLVCTAIVESGVHLPNVNTMVVDRADLLGLAQLYQLRGRVGRGDRRATCLLLTPEELTADARKRMRVLVENQSLGSGFRVASADLELQGGGNLLRAAQSGNIDQVGYDTWVELVEEAVHHARGELDRDQIEPEVEVPVRRSCPTCWSRTPTSG